MNVISAYLDTMFTAYPASPRLREAKAELHGMMEDAYSGYIESGLSENEAVGRVITEFGNLDELAPVLGITTEIAPVASETADAAAHPHVSPITQQEATLYAAERQRTEPQLAQGVALLVASPATLVMLSSLGTAPWAPFTTNTGSLIGLIVLLVMALAGVLLIVKRSQQLAPFSNITSGTFRRSPGGQGRDHPPPGPLARMDDGRPLQPDRWNPGGRRAPHRRPRGSVGHRNGRRRV